MDRMPLKQLMKYFVNHPVPPMRAMISGQLDERPVICRGHLLPRGQLTCRTSTLL
jgi:hypothetical protein